MTVRLRVFEVRVMKPICPVGVQLEETWRYDASFEIHSFTAERSSSLQDEASFVRYDQRSFHKLPIDALSTIDKGRAGGGAHCKQDRQGEETDVGNIKAQKELHESEGSRSIGSD